MKKLRLNNRGFALVETIVVMVFVVSIFMMLYTNYFPLMSKFEKREYYDDVDTKYKAFWLKYIIEDSSYVDSNIKSGMNYTIFSCNNLDNLDKQTKCNNLIKEMGLLDNPYCKDNSGDTVCKNLNYVAIITSYQLNTIKETINNTDSELGSKLSDGFISYIMSLPNYSNASEEEKTKYRILLEYYDENNKVYKYAQIEVTK